MVPSLIMNRLSHGHRYHLSRVRLLGDEFLNVVPNRAKISGKPVIETSASFADVHFKTFIATDTINNVCGCARKTLSDNVIRVRARNNHAGTEESACEAKDRKEGNVPAD